MKLEISDGELLDKLSILEIKANNITDTIKLSNVNQELHHINLYCSHLLANPQLSGLYSELKLVNQKLWDIEDKIRLKEKHKTFDQEFIELARSVYITNDQRAAIKKTINIVMNSSLIEEKSYEPY